MFKQWKPFLLVLISIVTLIAAFYAEHCAVKSYRLAGNIEGIRNIESGVQEYVSDGGAIALKAVALYKVREGLSMLNVMSRNHSFIEHVFDYKFPIANPNNNIHEGLYEHTTLNLKEIMAVLKRVQKTSYERRALQLLESLDNTSQ
jgi:hypothetical protein